MGKCTFLYLNFAGILHTFISYLTICAAICTYLKIVSSLANSYIIRVSIDRTEGKLLIASSGLLAWIVDLKRNPSFFSLKVIPGQPVQVELVKIKKVEYISRMFFPIGLGKFIFVLSDDYKMYFYTYASDLFFGKFSQKGYKEIGRKIADYVHVPFTII